MFKINLVPEVQEKKQKVAKTNSVVATVSVVVVAIIGISLFVLSGWYLVNKAAIANLNNKIAEKNTEIAKYAELEKTVLSLENGLASSKKIFDSQNTWSRLLPHLQAATPGDVVYTTLSLEPGKITADLTGNDVNSLARFVTSYKNYELLVMSGTGEWGETAVITVDSQPSVGVPVKSVGTWVYSTPIDLNKDHTIKVVVGDKTDNLTYTAATKEIKSETGSTTVALKKLFTNVEVKQYSKSDKVVFSATINYDGALLW